MRQLLGLVREGGGKCRPPRVKMRDTQCRAAPLTLPPSPPPSSGTAFAVEGANFVANGKLVSLSEQQIVSCDKEEAGCNGGDQLPALNWVAKEGGLCLEADYPYTSGGGSDGKCKTTCTKAVQIKGGVEIQKNNETALMAALLQVPVTLSVDASDDSIWQSYSGGVVTQKCACKSDSCLDHAVGGTGWGVSGSQEYFIVRNSWGASCKYGTGAGTIVSLTHLYHSPSSFFKKRGPERVHLVG